MPRFSANISIMWTELPFLERFKAAREAGFEAVECWFPYDHDIDTLKRVLADNRLTLNGINTVQGEPDNWGLAGVPGREDKFRTNVEQALTYARALGVTGIHVMAGFVGPAGRERHLETYRDNLRWAAEQAEGITLVIEPLNARDRPNYLVSRSDDCIAVIEAVGRSNVKLLFDVYHIQIGEGDILTRLKRHFPHIGHIQIAAVPSRAEPDEGEIDYRTILREIDALGWKGWVGCEYKPRADALEGLKWRKSLGV